MSKCHSTPKISLFSRATSRVDGIYPEIGKSKNWS